MKAISFPQANKILKAPAGQENDIGDLPVWQGADDAGNVRCISCWEPTAEERVQIAAGGPVWLWVHGFTHPPLVLDAANPFELSPPVDVRPTGGEPAAKPGRMVSRLLPATIIASSVQLYAAPRGRIVAICEGSPDQAPASGPQRIEIDRVETAEAFDAWEPAAGRCVVFEEPGQAQGMFRLGSLPTYPVSVLVERVEP